MVGYVDTDSGCIALTDGIWVSAMPITDQSSLSIDVGQERVRIPVYAFSRDDHRYLLIALDDNKKLANGAVNVSVVDPLTEAEILDRKDQIPEEGPTEE